VIGREHRELPIVFSDRLGYPFTPTTQKQQFLMKIETDQMNRRLPLIQCLFLGLGLLTALSTGFSADDPVDDEVAVTPADTGQDAETRRRTLVVMGYMFGQQLGLNTGYTEEELESVMEGLGLAAAGADLGEEATALREEARALFMEKRGLLDAERRKKIEEANQRNREEGEAFFAELDKDESVMKTPSGLRYTIVSEGDGAHPEPTSTVRVEYTGTRINGEVFDSTENRGEPVSFPLNRVVKGWTEGLQLIGEGGKIKLYIPPDLGYGKNARPGGTIQPGDTLIFDISLLEVLDALEASELAKQVPNYVPPKPPSGPPPGRPSGPPPSPPPAPPKSSPPAESEK
jgi:FKBP-type peptidyl-prolyl cis-trans isomerase